MASRKTRIPPEYKVPYKVIKGEHVDEVRGTTTNAATGVDEKEANEIHLQRALSGDTQGSVPVSGVREVLESTPLSPLRRWEDPFKHVRWTDTIEAVLRDGLANGFSYYMDERDAEWLRANNKATRSECDEEETLALFDGLFAQEVRFHRRPECHGSRPNFATRMVVSEDEFELIMGLYEALAHEKAQTLQNEAVFPESLPSFFQCQQVFSSELSTALFAQFVVPQWIPEPAELCALGAVIYSYWCERKVEHGGNMIIPVLSIGDAGLEDEPYVCFRTRSTHGPKTRSGYGPLLPKRLCGTKPVLQKLSDCSSRILRILLLQQETARREKQQTILRLEALQVTALNQEVELRQDTLLEQAAPLPCAIQLATALRKMEPLTEEWTDRLHGSARPRSYPVRPTIVIPSQSSLARSSSTRRTELSLEALDSEPGGKLTDAEEECRASGECLETLSSTRGQTPSALTHFDAAGSSTGFTTPTGTNRPTLGSRSLNAIDSTKEYGLREPMHTGRNPDITEASERRRGRRATYDKDDEPAGAQPLAPQHENRENEDVFGRSTGGKHDANQESTSHSFADLIFATRPSEATGDTCNISRKPLSNRVHQPALANQDPADPLNASGLREILSFDLIRNMPYSMFNFYSDSTSAGPGSFNAQGGSSENTAPCTSDSSRQDGIPYNEPAATGLLTPRRRLLDTSRYPPTTNSTGARSEAENCSPVKSASPPKSRGSAKPSSL